MLGLQVLLLLLCNCMADIDVWSEGVLPNDGANNTSTPVEDIVERDVEPNGRQLVIHRRPAARQPQKWTVALPCPTERNFLEGALAACRMREAKAAKRISEDKLSFFPKSMQC